jgi:hypothetical protein
MIDSPIGFLGDRGEVFWYVLEPLVTFFPLFNKISTTTIAVAMIASIATNVSSGSNHIGYMGF